MKITTTKPKPQSGLSQAEHWIKTAQQKRGQIRHCRKCNTSHTKARLKDGLCAKCNAQDDA